MEVKRGNRRRIVEDDSQRKKLPVLLPLVCGMGRIYFFASE
jgi:hypothetical protein